MNLLDYLIKEHKKSPFGNTDYKLFRERLKKQLEVLSDQRFEVLLYQDQVDMIYYCAEILNNLE
eukprot:snap_masked-scaffold_59-processed-gene-0.28-mRNA-1 protein AED:1.00 eAED:1.00 QI:0/0/0/0/1/1/2/0/63